jgi:hypothetical protein
LVHFITSHQSDLRGLTGEAEEELGRLDSQVYAHCQLAGLAIPEGASSGDSPYRPYGNAKIPSYRSNTGLHVCATPNWRQGMDGLRRTAELRSEMSAQPALAPHEPSGAGLLEGTETAREGNRWLTLTAAAQLSGVDKGVLSRAANRGQLRSNGQTRSQRRVCAIDLCRWLHERATKPEPTESSEHVAKLLRDA